jgi:subtilisin family serine protease
MSRRALAIAAFATLGLIALVPAAVSARGFFGGGHFAAPSHSFRPNMATRGPSRMSTRRINRTSDYGRRWSRPTDQGRRLSRTSEGRHPYRPYRPGKRIVTGGGDGHPKRPPWHPRPPRHHVPPVIGGIPPYGGSNPPSAANPGSGPPGGNTPGGSTTNNAGPSRAGFNIPPADERRYRRDEVLIDAGSGNLDAIARRHRLTRMESYRVRLTGRTIHRLHIDDGRAVPTVIRALAGDTRIAAAQPNYLFSLQDDVRSASQAEGLQYVVAKLRLEEAHRITTGEKVLVAVIDTGIDTSHPYLSGAVAGSFNALDDAESPNEHGTAMAGAIAERGDLIGVAPRARILSVRAFAPGASGDATTLGIIKGLDWAVLRGARVVNMSFAGPPDPALEAPISAAYRKGVAMVAAVGNNGPRAGKQYPAADPHVIAVTATDADDKLFDRAVRGDHIAVAAPGVDVLAPILGGGVEAVTGTSIAAAHVTGVIALLLELKPTLRPDDVRRILKASAVKLSRRPDETGAGLVDAAAAIKELGPTAAVSDAAARGR